MSVDRPSPLTDDHGRNPKSTRERSSALDQKPIDQRLKHLKEEVLPFYPFLLTVPTDVPFRLGGHFVNNWAVGDDGPFTLEEHQLQYMTFLAHNEGDSLLVAVGDWSDGAGSIMSDQRPGLQSATNTPSSGTTKKKISLNDYKNKWKDGASDSPVGRKSSGQIASTSRVLDDRHQTSKASLSEQSTPKPANTRSPPHTTSENVTGRKRPPDPEIEHVKSNNKEHSEQLLRKSLDYLQIGQLIRNLIAQRPMDFLFFYRRPSRVFHQLLTARAYPNFCHPLFRLASKKNWPVSMMNPWPKNHPEKLPLRSLMDWQRTG